MGPDFAAHSTHVLQVLLVGIVANCAAQVPYALIQATGRADLTAKVHLIEIPAYVCLGYFMIKKFGIEGAAIVWSLRLVLESGVLLAIARRYLSVSLTDARHQSIPQIILTLFFVAIAGYGIHSNVMAVARQSILTLFLAMMLIATTWNSFLTVGERRRVLDASISRFSIRRS
jgi:O-antigen/teichoic acid export membrane protein